MRSQIGRQARRHPGVDRLAGLGNNQKQAATGGGHDETESTMMTATGHPVTATARRLPGEHLGMPQAWSVTLRYRGRTMRVKFGQGSAHTEAPTAADVVECLASDASTYDQTDGFGARDFGFDPDSWADEKVYRAVAKQTERFRALLGDDFDAVVYADAE